MMECDMSGVEPTTTRCPTCGDSGPRRFSFHYFGIDVDDPLLATPVARLCAVAVGFGILVQDLDADQCEGHAGGLAIGFNERGEAYGMICLSEDLDDGLRADALAFGIAVLIADPARVRNTPDAYIGLGRERLPAARRGTGHLVWHMLRLCGRITPSATFELVDIP